MNELRLNFHGVSVSVDSDDPGVIESLRRDFSYFVAEGPSSSKTIYWYLYFREPEWRPNPKMFPSFRTREYAVFDQGSTRIIHYPEGAVAIYDFRVLAGQIYCADADRLHELAYLAVLSRVGEELDHRGMHRIHSMGFEHEGSAGVVLLPSGGGKSTLALEIARSSSLGVVSEDTPILTQDGRLRSFPLRWGFLPAADLSGIPGDMIRRFRRKKFGIKQLVDVDFFASKVRDDVPVKWIFIGERKEIDRPRIEPIGRFRAFYRIFVHLIVGYGIPQMSEYMVHLSLKGGLNLVRIANSRLTAAVSLLRQGQCYRYILCSDAKKNLGVLEDFIKAKAPHGLGVGRRELAVGNWKGL